MSRTATVGATVCGFIALACQSPKPLTPSHNASLVQTCAPWDGPAVALFLTDRPAVATYPQPPYSAITIYRDISEVLNRHFDVSSETQNLGQGQDCPAVGECSPVTSASVSFGGLNADSTVEVTYRVTVTPNKAVSGRGRARLNPARGRCG